MAARKKVRTARAKAKKRSLRPVFRMDVCGQDYEVVIDPDLKGEGECDYEANLIRLSPRAFSRMFDTFVHETLHAIFDASGLEWMLRKRLKMSKAEWRDFEEDFIVRPMTPALLSTFKRAGMLRAPAFLRKRTAA